MKFNIKLISIVLLVVGLLSSCEETTPDPNPGWNYVLHGFGQIKSDSPTNFVYGNSAAKIDFSLAWVSIDNQGTAESMDVFVTWNEKYVDNDGNNQTANHGRRMITTLTGLGGNRESKDFSVSVSDLRSLFGDVTFDYGDGAVSAFNNPKKPQRNDEVVFTDEDAFIVSWAIRAMDGKYFDSWSASVCGDFTGANCTIPFFVVCESNLEGTYTLNSVAQGPWGCTAEYNGTARWGKLSNTTYQVYTTNGGEEFSDFSFGSFFPCYGADQGALPNGSLVLNDVCNALSYTGASQWGEIYSFNSISVSDDGSALTIDWINDYGEGGLATFTRTDGSTWPALTK